MPKPIDPERTDPEVTTIPAGAELATNGSGYSDDAMTLWGAGDVDELSQFMDIEIDLSSVPTVEERQKQAKIAVQKRANDLLGHDIVWVAWRPQEALLVAEGTITEGFFAVGRDLTTGDNVSMFIGGVALVRTLKRVQAPMRAKLEKRGRTLVFA